MQRIIIACLIVAILFPVTACPPIRASEILLLGPEKYLRTSGDPDHYSRRFSGLPGDAVIVLQNGDNSGEKRVEDGVSSATIRVNGAVVFSAPDFNKNLYEMKTSLHIFQENSLTVDLASAPESYLTIRIYQENPSPQVQLQGLPDIIASGQPATLSWTSQGGEKAFFDQGIGSVALNGVISVFPEHTTTYTLTITGPLGTVSNRATIRVAGTTESLSEGSFGKQYQDIIPDDATLTAYDEKRFSLITGHVEDVDGLPLEDVAVAVLDHPEYGSTATDQKGHFSIPVEGGKTFTVSYAKAGLLDCQRKVFVPWNDIAIVDTIGMIAADPKATSIAFDGNPETILTHQSSPVRDAFGSRSCTLVFSGNNEAHLLDDNGSAIMELSKITVRATEYTRPAFMPAKLPANSAFTYCVELAVDGAKNVRFTTPVTIWVDNFLGFDVGEIVPVGFYNKRRGLWEPSSNGAVVELLDLNADTVVDALDATGDGLPDDLNQNGSFTDEVKGLSTLQHGIAGATFWRAEASHFTPYDLNLPAGSPSDAVRPNATEIARSDTQADAVHSCQRATASFVEDRSRIFHEDIPLGGTDMTLHYASNRVQGYQTRITVPVSGNSVPASLKRVIAKLNIGGRVLIQEIEPLPDQAAEFLWDGRDYLGKSMQTPISAHVAVGFVYDALYYRPGDFEQAFGQPGIESTGIPGREEIVLWNLQDLLVTPSRSKGTAHVAEGWTLSLHHHMNLQDCSSLYKGDGTLVHTNVRMIDTLNLTGNLYQHYPDSIAVDAAGNIYAAESFRGVVYKIDPGGSRTNFAGRFNWWGYSGDGGPAWDAQLEKPYGVALDNSGNVYITDLYRIRKVDAAGIITTIAGTGVQGYSGDGGPAVLANLHSPKGLTVDDDGNIYFAEAGMHSIRKIAPNGIITTIAGTGVYGFSGDGGPASDAQLSSPSDVAVDRNGNLYIADSGNNRVRRVDPSGIITTVAGSGSVGFWGGSYGGDGGPAVEARLRSPQSLDVDSQGNIYISDSVNLRLRVVNTQGIITTIAGAEGFGGDGGVQPASLATFKDLAGVAVDAAGSIYVADTENNSVRKIFHPAAFGNDLLAGSNVFAESNGTGHVISIEGLHTETVDLESGIPLFTFQYNEANKLASITDRFGNTTRIERDVSGSPLAIIAPEGITTGLLVNASDQLTRVTYPDGSGFDFTYTGDGLLMAKIEPEGNRFDHFFDDTGRLAQVKDPEGGYWNYSVSSNADGSNLTVITSAEGNMTSYLDHTDSTGAFTSIIRAPTEAETYFSQSPDSLLAEKRLPCGMDFRFTYDLDAEYRYRFLKTVSETTPSGLERIHSRSKTYQDTNYDTLPDFITETFTLNGKSSIMQRSMSDAVNIYTSPEGRIRTITYDTDSLLPTRFSTSGLFDTLYTYDANGRVIAISTQVRKNLFSYNDHGFLETFTDAENQTTRYTYDDLGRIRQIERPDLSFIRYSYDQNGNMTVLTVPASIDHEFAYNGVNLKSAYTTPLSGSYRYLYDGDRQLTMIDLPSGSQINLFYDTTRLTQIKTPESTIDYTYLCGNQLQSISKAAETVAYDYDGTLVTAEMSGGTLNQTLTFDYDNDFQLIEFFYAGDIEKYTYDKDGLLTGAGDFAITRDPENGFPDQVSNETVFLGSAFNGYGEIEAKSTRVNDISIDAWQLDRNDSGRIIAKSETRAGVTSRFVYTYDPAGRILSVTRNGTLTEAYQYDANGSRSYEMNLHKNIPGRYYTYSDEDHLLRAGGLSYDYNLDGFLIQKTDGAETTHYHYSALGELMRVVLPDETVIEYIYDPLSRRIAKKKNGEIVEKYLWHGLTRLLAVYDGSDRLIMRFQYANARTPVSMTMAGIRYYLCYDPIGTLRAIADSAGNVVKRIDSDTFGGIISDTNPDFSVPFGFAGGLIDHDTGLIKFGYRDYDPDIGRWTAKDPIFFAGGDTDLFGYCMNDPVNLVDPEGLEVLGPGIYESYHLVNNIRYSHTNLKGSILFTDYSTKIHDAKGGLFSSTKTNLGVSTSLLGGGAQFVFDLNDAHDTKRLGELSFSFGFGRYLGLTIYPELEQISINIGLGFSPPISISTQIDTIDHSCN